ncbi:hypothetical protein [Faecalibacter sp. LW9]|uniref:hypothetical protein n=1 Tax=Faecalibacter sp. LW9 TaxID=3103144 RepID=UPI002AFE8AAA|nr:hypothetical protein [Faecalibacter sp. LW9]
MEKIEFKLLFWVINKFIRLKYLCNMLIDKLGKLIDIELNIRERKKELDFLSKNEKRILRLRKNGLYK